MSESKKLKAATMKQLFIAQMQYERVKDIQAERMAEIREGFLRSQEEHLFGKPHPFAACLAIAMVVVSFVVAFYLNPLS